jgi:SAM-dependent methyltransferase
VKTLDLGCGDRKTKGTIGIDCVRLPGVDIIHDLNRFPYPFEDNTFDKVLMLNIIEHLDDTIKVMREVYRILKPGGIVHIETVYWNHKHSISDPQHKHLFNEHSWEFYTGKRKQYYTDYAFEMLSLKWLYDYKNKYLFLNFKPLMNLASIFLCNVKSGMVVEMRKPT